MHSGGAAAQLNGSAGGAAALARGGAGGGGGGTSCSLSPRQITNFILVEVINAKLTANGYRGLSHPFDPHSVQRNPPLSMLSEAALEMVRQFETRYIEKNQEDLSNYQISPDRFEEAYHVIIEGIFHRGINWGRVVALISLTGMMSLAAMRTDHAPEVANILDWTSSYITTHLWSWIQSNGGWVSWPFFSTALTGYMYKSVKSLHVYHFMALK